VNGGLICEKTCIGKPSSAILDIIRSEHSIPSSELDKIVMIGDNTETDIAFANNCGIDSCLVLTGNTGSEEEAKCFAAQNELFKPSFILDSFGASLD